MAITFYRRQDRFLSRMMDDYRKGLIPQSDSFATYFKWRANDADLTGIDASAAYDMLDVCRSQLERYYAQHGDDHSPAASGRVENPKPSCCVLDFDGAVHEAAAWTEGTDNDPWAAYRQYGDDCYVVSYLETIQSDLESILPLLR